MKELFRSGATCEARCALADWLREQAETAATGSRDFGRGFMHAIRVLESAPVRCLACPFDPASPPGPWNCPRCGRYWVRVAGGWTSPAGH